MWLCLIFSSYYGGFKRKSAYCSEGKYHFFILLLHCLPVARIEGRDVVVALRIRVSPTEPHMVFGGEEKSEQNDCKMIWIQTKRDYEPSFVCNKYGNMCIICPSILCSYVIISAHCDESGMASLLQELDVIVFVFAE